MKRISIFIGLKIVEILGVCGIVGIFYCLHLGLASISTSKIFIYSIAGIVGGGIVALFFLSLYAIGTGIALAIKANWRWAGRLTK